MPQKAASLGVLLSTYVIEICLPNLFKTMELVYFGYMFYLGLN